MKELVLKRDLIVKVLLAFSATVAAVLFPQLFHYFGATSGAIFLPMHLPVLLAAFFGGPIVGLFVGAASPLLSFAVSGMPALAILPFMVVELAAYGFVAGLFKDSKIPTLFGVFTAQIAGRVIRLIAIVSAVYAFNSMAVTPGSVWSGIVIGLPGILLQLVTVPVIVRLINSRRDVNGIN